MEKLNKITLTTRGGSNFYGTFITIFITADLAVNKKALTLFYACSCVRSQLSSSLSIGTDEEEWFGIYLDERIMAAIKDLAARKIQQGHSFYTHIQGN